MKIMKSIFLALVFALSLNAQLSPQTMSYLSNDNFKQAKISIEKDLDQDKFDAKAWYFYSRILYELDYPKAAKEALNNALNIDKTASFAKGGLSALRPFGGDILDAIERNKNEPIPHIQQITAEEYDAYLNQVFGRNHDYSNMNPPSESILARAKARSHQSSQQNSYSSSSSASNYASSSNRANYASSSSKSVASTQEEGSGFSFIFIVFILGLGIFFLVKASKKPKKEAQPLPFNVDALLSDINQLANDTEDLLKNVELINKNSLLYQELFNLNKKILLLSRQASTSPSLQTKQDYEEYKALYKILEEYFYKRDYDLRDYDKKKRELNQQSFASRQNFSTQRTNSRNEALYDKEAFARQSRQAPAPSGSTFNFLGGLLNFIGSILKILLIVGMSNRSSGGSSRSSGRSRGNDDFFGGASRSNRNNSNDDFWGSSRSSSSKNNSNDDFWGSSSSSRNNSNDSFWGSSGGSSRGGGSKSDSW